MPRDAGAVVFGGEIREPEMQTGSASKELVEVGPLDGVLTRLLEFFVLATKSPQDLLRSDLDGASLRVLPFRQRVREVTDLPLIELPVELCRLMEQIDFFLGERARFRSLLEPDLVVLFLDYPSSKCDRAG